MSRPLVFAPNAPALPRRHRAHARQRGRLWSALSVALAAVGCAPPGPRVILVHGTPGSASSWADYLLSPPPGMEVLALDRPGFGASDPMGAMTSLAAMLPLVTAKAVIMHGTKDDLVSVANVPFMQARLTGARCVQTVLLEGRNHFLPWNSEDVVRTALRSALETTC